MKQTIEQIKVEIFERQRNRFVVLFELYKLWKDHDRGGKDHINWEKLVNENHIKTDNYLTNDIQLYLGREGYAIFWMDGDNAVITYEGMRTVEYLITNPDESTTIFPSFNSMKITD